MNSIKGKTVLITGGAKGIGMATAIEFAKAGAKLIIVDIDANALEAAHATLSSYTDVVAECRNICDPDQMKTLTEFYVDILINNAGVGYTGEIKDTSIETWKHLININLLGPLNVFYAFLPHFMKRKSGHIVNVCSGQSFFQLPTWGAYAAIKAALGVFSRVSKYELAKYNIKVTTVYPFMVNTGFYDNVKAETWGTKLSMKLIPYYSNTPQTVGKIIFNAVKNGKSIEMVNPINFVGEYIHFIPYLHNIVSRLTFKILGQ